MARALATAATALAAVSMVACGGGSGDREEGIRALETDGPAMLLAAADGLCATAQVEQEEIRREVGGDQLTLDDRARLLVDLAPVRVRLGRQLTALEKPEGADRAASGTLVRAARSRGAASTLAGELWERGAREERIAAAAAQEHDDRVAFVEAARRLGLKDCAERLSGPERREVEATLDRALTAPAVRKRCRGYGERYLEQEFGGGVDACSVAASPPLRADRVEIRELQGMDEVFAVAQIEVSGGGAPGRYRARITYEDGAYRIDKLD